MSQSATLYSRNLGRCVSPLLLSELGGVHAPTSTKDFDWRTAPREHGSFVEAGSLVS